MKWWWMVLVAPALLVPALGVVAFSVLAGGQAQEKATRPASSEFPEFVYYSAKSEGGYSLAVENQELFAQMPCYCGCGAMPEERHRNLLDCFISYVKFEMKKGSDPALQRELASVKELEAKAAERVPEFAALRTDKDLASIPVIMLTSVNRRSGLKFSAEDLGEYYGCKEPEAFIDKPIELQRLYTAIEGALAGSSQAGDAPGRAVA